MTRINLLISVVLWLALAVVFVGCEGETTKTFIVRNDSDESVLVDAETVYGHVFLDSIPTGNSREIAINQQLGGVKDPTDPLFEFERFLVINPTSDTAEYQSNNWNISVDRRKKVPAIYHHQYVLRVTAEDFQ